MANEWAGWSLKDIQALLKTCAQTGVKRFHFQGLQVSFGLSPTEWKKQVSDHDQKKSDKILAEDIEKREIEERERQMQDLLLEHPHELEKLIEQGELQYERDPGESEGPGGA